MRPFVACSFLVALAAGCPLPSSDAPPPEPPGSPTHSTPRPGVSTSTGTTGLTGDTGTSSTGEVTFEVQVSLASDVDKAAPTTVGIVTWSASAPVTEAEIQFGLDGAFDMVAPVDLSQPDHRTLLLGMKPARTYAFRIVATADGSPIESAVHTITTGADPGLTDVTIEREPGSEPGFLVVTDWSLGAGPNRGWTYVFDADGDLVWWFQDDITNPVGDRIRVTCSARISDGGQSMWVVTTSNQGAGLQRVSMDTLESEVFDGFGATHDLITRPGADCATFIAYRQVGDLYEICAGDAKPTMISNLVAQGGTARHLNSLRYDDVEDIFVVSDHTLGVYGVDPSSGDVVWGLSSSLWGSRQHGVHLLEDSLLLFANEAAAGGGSAVLEVSRDGKKELGRYAPGVLIPNLGDVQRLPGGNTLVTLSGQSTVREISPQGKVVMEMTGVNVGYGFWMSSLYEVPARP